jgi:hypothetical protein
MACPVPSRSERSAFGVNRKLNPVADRRRRGIGENSIVVGGPPGHVVRSRAAVALQEYAEGVNLTIGLDREEDGCWIAKLLSFQA